MLLHTWVILAFSKMQTPIPYVFDETWDAENKISKQYQSNWSSDIQYGGSRALNEPGLLCQMVLLSRRCLFWENRLQGFAFAVLKRLAVCLLSGIKESLSAVSTNMCWLDELQKRCSSESLYPVSAWTESYLPIGEMERTGEKEWSRWVLGTPSNKVASLLRKPAPAVVLQSLRLLTFEALVITGQLLDFPELLAGCSWREHSLCQELANAFIPEIAWLSIFLKILLCWEFLRKKRK